MELTLHTYYNGQAVTLNADHIEKTIERSAEYDAQWHPEGPKPFTEIFMKEGHTTSNGTSKAFVSETPEIILSVDPLEL